MARKKGSARQRKADVSLELASRPRDEESRSELPSQSIPSDHELFDRSDTAEEFGENEEGSLWPVKDIVSEEVDLFKTSIYQIDWEDWKRSDGTSTTWATCLPGPNTVLRSWKSTQTKKRRQKALETPDIDLATVDSFRPHNIRTAEMACAYAEKLKLWPVTLGNWDTMKHPAHHDRGLITENNLRIGRKRKRGNLMEHSASSSSIENRDMDINIEVLDLPSGVASGSKQPLASSTFHGYSEELVSNRSSPQTRETIWNVEARWNAAAVDKKAASIRVINEVNGDPPVDTSFVYLEASREYIEGVRKPDPGFLIGCDCKDGCRNPLLCSCLMDSHCIDEDGELCPAYDKKGRFLFSNQREVVECNRNCTCRSCGNNVAQRPRTIPIEVFKTRNNGWGVRPTVFVPTGTVLGLFAGKSEALAGLKPEERGYSFDLDARDDDPDFKSAEKYTISAHSVGNWTRFINHSCGPSAKVYSVVIDTAVQDNMPYIAFVACEDIPARKEITIDYNPGGPRTAMVEKKGKGKKSDRTLCICGSEMCRGFI